MSDEGLLPAEERRRLLEANAAAARFYRRELLRATDSWPVQYLKWWGAEDVLSTESAWKVGYAPSTWTSLVDHLRGQGFGFGTLVRAGLVTWTDGGDAVDRHRDQLMFVARDQRLSPVGFVGIGQDGLVRTASPVTAVHRPSNVLVGVEEQLRLLESGAIPVIVDRPVDAIAISEVSRRSSGEWAGIPVCGGGLSTAQARMLRRYSATDKVIVALSGDEPQRHQTAGYLLDLAFFFDRVRAIGFPAGYTPASLALTDGGAAHLHDVLSTPLPLMTYRSGASRRIPSQALDSDPPDLGPDV
jgi:DNA primase